MTASTLPPLGPEHLSVSQLKMFLQCPRKYFYCYIHKTEPAFRPVALAFGSAWHATIAHLLLGHDEGQVPSAEELHDHLRDGLLAELGGDGPPVLFDDDEDEGQLVNKALAMIDVFASEVQLPDKVVDLELPFAIDLFEPDTGEILPVPLVGALDAVVIERGRPTIWELKTGKRRWGADQLAYDFQPTAYLLAAKDLDLDHADLKLVLTTKAQKPALQIEPITRAAADEDDLAHVALGVLKAVHAGVDYPVRDWPCRGCPYAGECR